VKILCVLLPHFPLRCEIRRQPALKDRPAMVVRLKDPASSQKIVVDYSPGLKGLQSGMPLQNALALHGLVEIITADIPCYFSVFSGILDALEKISPLVEGPEPGTVYIGLDGLQLLYPTDDILASRVREAIDAAFEVRMGIAEGKFPAYIAAMHSPPGGYRALAGGIDTFLRDLPCDVLPIAQKSKDRLRDFGIQTLGQVAGMSPGPLQAQFGPEGKRIRDLARGNDDTPLYPRYMEETIEESTTLASVTVSLETILVTVEALLTRAFAREALKGRGVSRINLWTRILDAGHWQKAVRFKEPATDIKSVIARVKQVMENCPQPGPVEQIGIKITGMGYRNGRQKSLFSEVRAQDYLLEDIKQLELRLGSPQVYRIQEAEPWSRIPERRYALTPLNR